jgi:hypothetical protein
MFDHAWNSVCAYFKCLALSKTMYRYMWSRLSVVNACRCAWDRHVYLYCRETDVVLISNTFISHPHYRNTMQYSYSTLFVVCLCLLTIVDNMDALRLRLPALRLSSTFSRTGESLKKKLHVNDHGLGLAAKRVDLKVPPIERNNEF